MQQAGNVCDLKEDWKMNANGSHIAAANFLSSRFGNPSGPREFFLVSMPSALELP